MTPMEKKLQAFTKRANSEHAQATTVEEFAAAGPAKPEVSRRHTVKYSHEAMIELIVENPGWTHRQYAGHFGYGPGWFAAVLATDDFQGLLDKRRGEITDPSITATLKERFLAMTVRSVEVIQGLLDNPKVQDATALKAAEIGIKALGLGQKQKEQEQETPQAQSLDSLSDRLIALMRERKQAPLLEKARTEPIVIPGLADAEEGTVDVIMNEVKTKGISHDEQLQD